MAASRRSTILQNPLRSRLLRSRRHNLTVARKSVVNIYWGIHREGYGRNLWMEAAGQTSSTEPVRTDLFPALSQLIYSIRLDFPYMRRLETAM